MISDDHPSAIVGIVNDARCPLRCNRQFPPDQQAILTHRDFSVLAVADK